MVSILAIDFGKKRIGLAVSDALGITAQGLETMERGGLEEDVSRIGKLAEEHGVGEIVVGRPLKLDGTPGAAAAECEQFARQLREFLGIAVVMWDERLSTAQAERAMIEADLSRAKRKKARDRAAAQLILQSYLDARDRGKTE